MSKRIQPAFEAATQYEQMSTQIISLLGATHPREARDLAKYRSRMLGKLRRSYQHAGTAKGRDYGLQTCVWVVESMIILMNLSEVDAVRALAGASLEVLERMEESMRADGLLPPVIDD